MESNYRKLGKYIKEVNIKNSNNSVNKLLGVSVNKEFIPSIANTVGTDLSKYKVVKEGQFAYGPVTSRNSDKISIALLQENKCIISTSYTVFEIINTEELDPEYLMMWFRREEFDRYARYMSHGSVREIFGWEEMYDVDLPVPDIEIQREIVKEYNTIVNRIKLNNKIIQKLEETAQGIYKQWFVDFEFPDENFKENKESINVKMVKDLATHYKYTINPKNSPEKEYFHYSIPAYDDGRRPTIELGKNILSTKYEVPSNSILVSKLNPSFSRVWPIYDINKSISVCSTEFQVLLPNKREYFEFLYYMFKSRDVRFFLESIQTGTSNSHQRLDPKEIFNIPIENFNEYSVKIFHQNIRPVHNNISLRQEENWNLLKMKEVLLSKMSKIIPIEART